MRHAREREGGHSVDRARVSPRARADTIGRFQRRRVLVPMHREIDREKEGERGRVRRRDRQTGSPQSTDCDFFSHAFRDWREESRFANRHLCHFCVIAANWRGTGRSFHLGGGGASRKRRFSFERTNDPVVMQLREGFSARRGAHFVCPRPSSRGRAATRKFRRKFQSIDERIR